MTQSLRALPYTPRVGLLGLPIRDESLGERLHYREHDNTEHRERRHDLTDEPGDHDGDVTE